MSFISLRSRAADHSVDATSQIPLRELYVGGYAPWTRICAKPALTTLRRSRR